MKVFRISQLWNRNSPIPMQTNRFDTPPTHPLAPFYLHLRSEWELNPSGLIRFLCTRRDVHFRSPTSVCYCLLQLEQHSILPILPFDQSERAPQYLGYDLDALLTSNNHADKFIDGFKPGHVRGQNKRNFLLWEINFLVMQKYYIVPTVNGRQESPLLINKSNKRHTGCSYRKG